MQSLCLLVCASVASCANYAHYPRGTRQCMSTSTKPDGKLICPESRRKFCVKEIANVPEEICGKTQYYGDVYEQALCVYRKCAAECVEGSKPFVYAGIEYRRDSYCCEADFCNAGTSRAYSNALLVAAGAALIALILYTF